MQHWSIRYDTIEDSTRKLSIQLYLAHVTRKKNKKEETKTKKRQCPFNSLQVKIREGSPEEIGLRVTMEERICERDELSLEWKVEVLGRWWEAESEGGDCDEVICTGWGEPGGEWTEWGWRNEEGSWFHRWADACRLYRDKIV